MRDAAPAFDLEAYLAAEAEQVDLALGRALERLGERLESAAPDAPAPGAPGGGLLEVARHGVMTGGKRLRPILCVAAYRACAAAQMPAKAERANADLGTGATAGVGENADPGKGRAATTGSTTYSDPSSAALHDLAASLEMIHAYSLMHDDLPCMDDAELRRGKPTPHTVFGEARTTVAGAALIPAAALQAWEAAGALGCDDATRRAVVRELARAAGAGGMVGGQALDLMGEGRRLTPAELDELHGLKTGALLAASLRIGAIAAGAPAPMREALDRYGRAIGLAFQIVDDILDATASAGALGKNPSDRELDKSTYVALHGLDQARTHADERVLEARTALDDAGIDAPALVALSAFIVERGH